MSEIKGPFDKPDLPPAVGAAFNDLQQVAKRHNVSLADVLPVSPNQALMWQMSDEVRRLRNLLDRLAPGWNDDI